MKHIGTQSIETQRLLLRRFSTADAEEMYQNWANDAEVTRFLRWVPHKNAGETREVLAQWEKDYQNPAQYLWAIQRKEDGALIGSIGILPSLEDNGPDGFEPGYCIGRAFWGQGYTTEALAAALDYFIEGTGQRTLYCCHAVENPASGRVMQKNGFVYTHDGEYTRFDGSPVPAHFYILQKEE